MINLYNSELNLNRHLNKKTIYLNDFKFNVNMSLDKLNDLAYLLNLNASEIHSTSNRYRDLHEILKRLGLGLD